MPENMHPAIAMANMCHDSKIRVHEFIGDTHEWLKDYLLPECLGKVTSGQTVLINDAWAEYSEIFRLYHRKMQYGDFNHAIFKLDTEEQKKAGLFGTQLTLQLETISKLKLLLSDPRTANKDAILDRLVDAEEALLNTIVDATGIGLNLRNMLKLLYGILVVARDFPDNLEPQDEGSGD